jgi:hypothetical protein
MTWLSSLEVGNRRLYAIFIFYLRFQYAPAMTKGTHTLVFLLANLRRPVKNKLIHSVRSTYECVFPCRARNAWKHR